MLAMESIPEECLACDPLPMDQDHQEYLLVYVWLDCVDEEYYSGIQPNCALSPSCLTTSPPPPGVWFHDKGKGSADRGCKGKGKGKGTEHDKGKGSADRDRGWKGKGKDGNDKKGKSQNKGKGYADRGWKGKGMGKGKESNAWSFAYT